MGFLKNIINRIQNSVDSDEEYKKRLALEKYIEENIPDLKVVKSEATYLLWVDVSGLVDCSAEFASKIRKLTGLYVSSGAAYGECGGAFLRINMATQRERVLDGLERLKKGVELVKKA